MDVALFKEGGPLAGLDVVVSVNTYSTDMAADYKCESCGTAPGKDSVGAVLEMSVT